MKRILSLVVAVGLLGLVGCDQTIDKDPAQSIPAEDAFDTAQNVEAALNGLYSGLQSPGVYGGNQVMFNDLMAGNVSWDGSFAEYTNAVGFVIQADNGFVLQLWEDHYDVINRANAIIENTSTDIEGLDQDDVDRIVGQAKYIRAQMYFNLVRWYGDEFEPGATNDQPGVPVRTSPVTSFEDAESEPRASVSAVYDQVRSDVEDAISRLEVNSNPRRAGVHAANALLARVNLWQGNYEEAANLAQTVIDAQPYSLSATPSGPYVNEQSAEIVFAVSFSAIDNSGVNDHPAAFYLPSARGGRGEAFPSGILFGAAEAGPGDNPDIRTGIGQVDGDSLIYAFNGAPRTNKWTNTSLGDDYTHTRVAEMKLIRAEALATPQRSDPDPSTARELVDEIRTRAGLEPLADIAPNLSGQDLVDEIIRQRRLELAFEGRHRMTLDRIQAPIETPSAGPVAPDDPQRIFPIPEDVIETNDAISQSDQNPGF